MQNEKENGEDCNSCPLNDCIVLKTDVGTDLTIIKLLHHLLSASRNLRSQKQSKITTEQNRTKMAKWQYDFLSNIPQLAAD
jgi:hypothetical protein